jgi:hypothetical protein
MNVPIGKPRVETADRVKQQYKVLQRRVNIAFIPMLLALLTLFAATESMAAHAPKLAAMARGLTPIAFAVGVVAGIYMTWIWRCPFCKLSLGRSVNPKNCPKCGTELR